jgi:hypothetical protein
VERVGAFVGFLVGGTFVGLFVGGTFVGGGGTVGLFVGKVGFSVGKDVVGAWLGASVGANVVGVSVG